MYYIIVNPASKSGKGQRIWEQIETMLKSKNISYKVAFTAQSKDATNYASSFSHCCTKDDTLVILGGDGTLNEVIQGLDDPSFLPIGYIPTGSSNDFARDCKISTKPMVALEHILSKTTPATFDIGEVIYHSYDQDSLKVGRSLMSTTRRFLVSCGIGFDAAVCEKAMSSRMKDTFNKIGLGKLTYTGIALRQLFSKRCGCSYQIDDEPAVYLKEFIFIASMLHRYEGGGFMFAPHADATDGLLDICMAGQISIPKILFILPQAFHGGHTKYKGITLQTASHIRIQADQPLWVHTDGEVLVKATDISMNCKKYQATFYL